MISKLQICLIAVVVVFAVVHIGTGLECYHCEGKDCTGNQSKPCDPKDTHCLKVLKGNGKDLLFKRCGTECDDYVYCYTCKTDNCNSSSGLTPSFLLLGIVGTIIAKYYM